MSLLEEVREELLLLFSRIELEVLDYLYRHPLGGTITEIARSINRSPKTLYNVLKTLQRNGWVEALREKRGRIGRPRNRYVLRCNFSKILSDLGQYECRGGESSMKILNLTSISYPYSLTIFKRYLTCLRYGECLIALIGTDVPYSEFTELAEKKGVRLIEMCLSDTSTRLVFRKTWG